VIEEFTTTTFFLQVLKPSISTTDLPDETLTVYTSSVLYVVDSTSTQYSSTIVIDTSTFATYYPLGTVSTYTTTIRTTTTTYTKWSILTAIQYFATTTIPIGFFPEYDHITQSTLIGFPVTVT
jgi:hypothetical protein